MIDKARASPAATVFVVDDDEVVARSLRWLIESIRLPVVTFATARDFLETYRPEQPGCLVLDVRMLGMSGIELQEILKQRQWGIPVLFITGHGDVQMAVRAIKAGAFDFIEKPFNDQDMLDRIQRALAKDAERRRTDAECIALLRRVESLTQREREVMHLVVDGLPNKLIADQLGLSAKTVEVHRARVMEKMGAHSISDLVKMALKEEQLRSTQ
ncbi:MAG: response regulator transcription factor [Rhodocyclales bacterium]|nr:response regulator transcription factor [Rhodocyclales bacterium]